MKSVVGPTCRECLFTYLSMMVFTCALLSRRAMQLSPFIFTLATFSILYHHWKGSGFKKGVCKVVLCFLSLLLGTLYGTCCGQRDPGSLHHCCPLLPILLFLIPSGSHKWTITDEVFGAATMVAVFLVCLGILHHSS